MKSSKYFGAVIAILMVLGTVSYGQANSVIVSKTGHVTLEGETVIGTSVIGPGDYEVHQVRTASGHWVEFTRMVDNTGEEGLSPSPIDWEVVAKVPCTMQSLNAPATGTSAEISKGSVAHLNSLRIRGENVVHVF